MHIYVHICTLCIIERERVVFECRNFHPKLIPHRPSRLEVSEDDLPVLGPNGKEWISQVSSRFRVRFWESLDVFSKE